jgi:predicted oxidoreductase
VQAVQNIHLTWCLLASKLHITWSENFTTHFLASKGFRVYALAQWAERAGIGARFPDAAIPQSPSLISGTVADHQL